jgi:hypothetical protein
MRKYLLAVAAALALASALPGMFINNTVQVPVDRVTKNVEAWIKDKPKDPQAYYVLGRIHAMAYAYGPNLSLWGPAGGGRGKGAPGVDASTLPADVDIWKGQLPGFAPYDSIRVQRRDNATDLSEDDAKHLAASIANYSKAVELDPKSAIYELGLAWILQETARNVATLPAQFAPLETAKPTDAEKTAYDALIKKLGDNDAKVREESSSQLAAAMPKPYAQLKALKSADPEVAARAAALVQAYWNLQALAHYRKAYELDMEKDIGRGGPGIAADSQVSAEAADQILVILKENPQAAKEHESTDVAANLKKMRGRGGPITPIIFALPQAPDAAALKPAELGDLIDSSRRVTFDLAADGAGRQWPWLKPSTALLVWDPAHTGKITDGRQLFGSRTWFVFFRNGYEALSTLDDNHDGKLTGPELQGIAVWQDKNANGISDPGEVITLQQAAITTIDTRSSEVDGTLTSSITFSNGVTIKSFDWVTLPVNDSSVAK